MKTLIIWIFRLLITVMLVAIAVPIAGSFFLKQKDVKATLADWVKTRTGRELNIDGRLGFEPGLQLRVYAENVRYQNADWATRPSAFEAERVSLDISLLDLLKGKVSIEEISLHSASLWIERKERSVFNLVEPKGGVKKPRKPMALPEWFNLSQANILNSKIVVIHPRRTWNITLDSAALQSEGQLAPLNVNAIGGVQGVPVQLEGSLGTLQSWFSRTSSKAALKATLADNAIGAVGEVADVLSWRGLDVLLAGRVDKLKHLSPLFFKSPLDIRQINGRTRLLQPETVRTMRLEKISASAVLRGIPMEVSGSVGVLLGLREIDLQIAADGPMNMVAAGIEISPNFKPNARIIGSLIGTSRSLIAEVESAEFKVDGAVLTAHGEIHNLSGEWDEALPLAFEISDLKKFGRVMEKEWPVFDVISGSAALMKRKHGFSLENISADSDGPLSRLSATGTIDPLGAEQSGLLDIKGEIKPSFFMENEYDLAVMPESVTITAQVKLADNSAAMIISSLQAELSGASVQGSGSIADLKQISNLSLNVNADISDLKALVKESDWQLPQFENIKVNGVLEGQGSGVWSFLQFVATVEENDQHIELAGDLNNLGKELDAQLDLSGTMSADAVIEQIPALSGLQQFNSEVGELEFDGLLNKNSQSKWSIAALDIKSSWLGAGLTVRGFLNEIGPAKGRLTVSVLGPLKSLPKILEKFNPPEIKHVDIRFDVPVGEEGVRNISATINSGTGVLSLEGDVEELAPVNAESIKLSLVADDFASLLPADSNFMPGLAVKADMDVALNPEGFTLSGLAAVGTSDFNGTVKWHRAEKDGGRPRLIVSARSKVLDLQSLLLKTESGPRLFSDESLAPSWTKKFDGSITIDAATFTNHSITLSGLSYEAIFNGAGTKQNITSESDQGKVSGSISTQVNGGSAINIEVEKLPVGAVNALSKNGTFQGGTLDAEVYLSGPGDSLASMVDKGSGAIAVDIANSKIISSALDAIGGDLLSNVITKINPFRERESIVEVHCGAIHFDLANGTASTRNGLAMKTDRVTLLGGGEISFPDESMKIVIAPKARKGLGISPSSIAKMVRIGGTLSKPKVEADAKGILKSGAAIGAAIFSGGLSLVAQGLIDRLQAGAEVCAIARGEQKSVKRTKPDQSEMR